MYVRNLYLEGASWNFEKSYICESVPLKFISQLPVIQFKPVENDVTKKKGNNGNDCCPGNIYYVYTYISIFQVTINVQHIIILKGVGRREEMLL